ncbi:hypothetical protein [Sulfurimonas sp. NWX79]|uniref:hypothetical protein n=1 Tax=Campylobacterales TaxID=213849 RepID=UPI003204758D|nr:hypothetical protein IAPFLPAM_00019 [Sulfurimonas phage SNW-1]
MFQIGVYKNMVIAGVIGIIVFALYFYIHGLNNKIDDLERSLMKNQVKLANTKLESTRYKAALDSQNKEMEMLRAQTTLSEAKLKKYKSKPPEVRYKVIYKTREVKSNECSDVQSVIDGVRAIDFSSL